MLTFGPSEIGTDINALCEKQTPEPLVPLELPPDSIVGITYTGGTTGKPKGVIGTTGSISTMTNIQLAEWEWPSEPRFLMCTPLSHAGAAFFLPTLMAGGSMVVAPKFDPAEVLEIIEKHRINSTMLVPSMLYALMDHPDSRPATCRASRRSTTGRLRSTRCASARPSTASGRSSPSTTGSPRRRW